MQEEDKPRLAGQRERHPPTFRDRPGEAIVNIVVISLVGGLVAYGCTALTLP